MGKVLCSATKTVFQEQVKVTLRILELTFITHRPRFRSIKFWRVKTSANENRNRRHNCQPIFNTIAYKNKLNQGNLCIYYENLVKRPMLLL
jgi:hypothetical protein